MAYNGWSNYETWLVALWVLDLLRNTSGGDLDAEQARNFVEEILDTQINDLHSGFANDLVKATLDNVVWQEIADAANEE